MKTDILLYQERVASAVASASGGATPARARLNALLWTGLYQDAVAAPTGKHIAPLWAAVVRAAADAVALPGCAPVLVVAQCAFAATKTESQGYQQVGYMGSKTTLHPKVIARTDDGLGMGQMTSARFEGESRVRPDLIASGHHSALAHLGACALVVCSAWQRAATGLFVGDWTLDQFANFWPGAGGGGCPEQLFDQCRLWQTAPRVTKSDLADGYARAGRRKAVGILAPSTYAALRGGPIGNIAVQLAAWNVGIDAAPEYADVPALLVSRGAMLLSREQVGTT